MRGGEADLLAARGDAATDLAVDRVLAASRVAAAEVHEAINPHYPELHERRNAFYLGAGVTWGHDGAGAEVMAHARALLDGAAITHQPGAPERSRRTPSARTTVLPAFTGQGIPGLVLGVPVLSTNGPLELVSKADVYEAFRAYRAFLAD